MNTNCPLYGAHYWKLDSKSYGRCQCGAEKDFKEKETRKTYSPRGIKFQTEFYKQSRINLDGIRERD